MDSVNSSRSSPATGYPDVPPPKVSEAASRGNIGVTPRPGYQRSADTPLPDRDSIFKLSLPLSSIRGYCDTQLLRRYLGYLKGDTFESLAQVLSGKKLKKQKSKVKRLLQRGGEGLTERRCERLRRQIALFDRLLPQSDPVHLSRECKRAIADAIVPVSGSAGGGDAGPLREWIKGATMPAVPGTIGLANPSGHSCSLNSALQLLSSYLYPAGTAGETALSDVELQLALAEETPATRPGVYFRLRALCQVLSQREVDSALVCGLQESFFRSYQRQGWQAGRRIPEQLFGPAAAGAGSVIWPGQDQDPHEFLVDILGLLEVEKDARRTLVQANRLELQIRGRGRLCRLSGITSPVAMLSLNVPMVQNLSLQKCIDHALRHELLSGDNRVQWTRDDLQQCSLHNGRPQRTPEHLELLVKEGQDVMQPLLLHQGAEPPEQILIHIKLFDYDHGSGGLQTRANAGKEIFRSIREPVEIPVSALDAGGNGELKAAGYRVTGAICHKAFAAVQPGHTGSLVLGHYIAVRFDGTQPVVCNDDRVRALSESGFYSLDWLANRGYYSYVFSLLADRAGVSAPPGIE